MGIFHPRLNQKKKVYKKKLIQSIKAVHPLNFDSIRISANPYVRLFEKNKFKNVFTLNYDLLLYWLRMEALKTKMVNDHDWQDGFSKTTWPGDKNNMNVFNLHGALHFFSKSDEFQYYKFLEKKSGVTTLQF